MENYNMQFNVRKVRIYQNDYRPSTSFPRFLKAVWSIILMGRSPINN